MFSYNNYMFNIFNTYSRNAIWNIISQINRFYNVIKKERNLSIIRIKRIIMKLVYKIILYSSNFINNVYSKLLIIYIINIFFYN